MRQGRAELTLAFGRSRGVLQAHEINGKQSSSGGSRRSWCG
jgi:hypothetical protein